MFFLLATSQFPANDLVLPPPALRDLKRSAEQGKKQKTEAPRTFLASRRGRVTGCVSAASLDGRTGWSLRGGWKSAAHTPLPASTVCTRRVGEGDKCPVLSRLLLQVLPGPTENMLESCLPRAFSQGIPRGFSQEKAIDFPSYMHSLVAFLV